ncbi:hypothetical protein GW813_08535 [bacterium]|nr:hypothetical protein [bacterium]PIV81994.1 MAG: hypothetical protein COW53_01345 [bacterium CG17_big_fil_post_rev_8_21_14_2_50_64_8]PJA73992.1 MAG: hypothetical protein CO151_11500 [bacterium CG_4_9_14_3_um_filter_65_15]
MTIKAEKLLPFAAGLFLSANLYILPFLAASPRVTDLGGLAFGVAFIVLMARRKFPAMALAALGVVGLAPMIWVFFSTLEGQSETLVLSARWLLAMPWAAALLLIQVRESRLQEFALGLVAGSFVNVAVTLLQLFGFENQLMAVGLSSVGANFSEYVSHQVRLPGLHGHHNASSAVTSLVVPAGFYLYYRGRIRLGLLVAGLLGLLLSLNLTSTRGPLVISVVTVFLAGALARRWKLGIVLLAVGVGIILPLLVVYGPPGGWARWRNTEAMQSNANERAESGMGGLELTIEHPQGLGVESSHKQMEEKTGIRSAHNAFLQTALVWSLPFGLLLAVGLALGILAGTGADGGGNLLTRLLAFHLAGLFMFEEHLNNPTFIILTAWLTAAALLARFRTGKFPAG